MFIDFYWLFPNSFMLGFSSSEFELELYFGIFAISFLKEEEDQ
jgi:hypothetical protein